VTVGLVRAIIVLAIATAGQQHEAHAFQPVLWAGGPCPPPLAVARPPWPESYSPVSDALQAVPIVASAIAVVKFARKDKPLLRTRTKSKPALEQEDARRAK